MNKTILYFLLIRNKLYRIVFFLLTFEKVSTIIQILNKTDLKSENKSK